MIKGRIRNREAIVGFDVIGPGETAWKIEAVIDTGYNGYLTLPKELIKSLQLSFAGHRRGRLADGSIAILDVYLAIVVWHGRKQDVLVSQTEGLPLVGMQLLRGCRVTMDVVEEGDVVIEELP